MGLIKWQENYAVGNGKLDQQHQLLFDYINELYDAMSKGAGKSTAVGLVQKLHEYTTIHFKEEEALLKRANSPLLKEQQAEHAIFLDKVSELEKKISSGHDLSISVDLLRFLKNWLSDHILEKDHRYRDSI